MAISRTVYSNASCVSWGTMAIRLDMSRRRNVCRSIAVEKDAALKGRAGPQAAEAMWSCPSRWVRGCRRARHVRRDVTSSSRAACLAVARERRRSRTVGHTRTTRARLRAPRHSSSTRSSATHPLWLARPSGADAQRMRKCRAGRDDGVVFAPLATRIDVAGEKIVEEILGQIATEIGLVQLARAHRHDPGPRARRKKIAIQDRSSIVSRAVRQPRVRARRSCARPIRDDRRKECRRR